MDGLIRTGFPGRRRAVAARPLRVVAVPLLAALVLGGCRVTVETQAQPVLRSAPSPYPSQPQPERASTGAVPLTTRSAIEYPAAGAGTFAFAGAGGPDAGTGGTLLTYRVAVEQGITGVDVAEFAGQVAMTFADPRGWTATGRWRLRQVAGTAPHSFTIYLATPATRDTLCASRYDRYTSCRNGERVVINVARWVHGVPHFTAGLTEYRQYVINHETGHRLGRGHELCPGPGAPASVMQQQTLGMHGCLPNAWPMVNGQPYSGRSGQYNDRTPTEPTG